MTAGSGFRRKGVRDGGINREKWAGKAGSENPIVDSQSKAQCKTFHVSISFTCMRIQKHFSATLRNVTLRHVVWTTCLCHELFMWLQEGVKLIRWPIGQQKLLNENFALNKTLGCWIEKACTEWKYKVLNIIWVYWTKIWSIEYNLGLLNKNVKYWI